MLAITECCEPLLDEPIRPEAAEKLGDWFSVLSDPTRLRLLSLMAVTGGRRAVCDLVQPLGVSQPTVSHHLKVLRTASLVESERHGRWVYYRPLAERLAVLGRALGG